MKYLVSAHPEYVTAATKLPPAGEPVIPWFPVGGNLFLGVDSLEKSEYAVVAEVPGFDPDRAADKLAQAYTGLPRTLIENYLLHTALAAKRLTVGTRLAISIDADSATLKVCDVTAKENKTITLWEKQPLC